MVETWFLADPLDTLWFRSGRPFVGGEASADGGLFPPTQWTFQGMLRTRILMGHITGSLDQADKEEIADLVGQPDTLPRGWRFTGPFPARPLGPVVEPWLPAPSFLHLDKTSGAYRAGPFSVAQREAPISDSNLAWVGVPRSDTEPASGWISASNMEWLLTDRGQWEPSGHREHSPPFLREEERFGVAVEDGVAKDHMLYLATHHRFDEGCGLLGGVEGEGTAALVDGVGPAGEGSRPAACVGPAGKRGRPVAYRRVHRVCDPWHRLCTGRHLEVSTPDTVALWVTLLTPALAEDEAPPFSTTGSGGVQVQVLAALAEGGEPVGGFRSTDGVGRRARSTWAAGGSWLLQLHGGTPEDRVDTALRIQGRDQPSDEFERFGFGQRLAALFDPETWRPLAPNGATNG